MRRLLLAALSAGVAAMAATPRFGAVRSFERGHEVELDRHGCVVAVDPDSPVVHLIFSADSMFEGGEYALSVLDSFGIKGNFFFTGNYLRLPEWSDITRRIIDGGHYVGSHSDRHLLLADWDAARTELVTPDSMLADLAHGYAELARWGVDTAAAVWTLPPYEWCSEAQAAVYRTAGITPVQPTPGIQTFRDYTVPGTPEYRTSAYMLGQLYEFEKERGLGGANILIHLGTWDSRTDKLYRHLPAIIDTLKARGYRIETLPR